MAKRIQKKATRLTPTKRMPALPSKRHVAVVVALVFAATGLLAMSFTSAATDTVNANAGGSLLVPATTVTKHANLRYSTASSRLLLDLHVPDKTTPGPIPLIVFVHGGSWRSGSKDVCYPATNAGNGTFMNRGFAVACINYRYSTEATYPAQIEDVKASIRWLRANASAYNLYTGKIGIWGMSAGGHLAALAGTTSDITAYDVGDNLDSSSKVDAVVDYFGPANLADASIGAVGTKGYTNTLKLVGGDGSDFNDRATAASPVTYVTADDAPFYIVHGTKDSVVPIRQSQLLDQKLKEATVPSQFIALPRAGHGGPMFDTPVRNDAVSAYFDSLMR